MDIFKAIGRMFTVPSKVRKQLDSNPAVQAAKANLAPALTEGLATTIDQNVADPTANALIKLELAHLIQASGIVK